MLRVRKAKVQRPHSPAYYRALRKDYDIALIQANLNLVAHAKRLKKSRSAISNFFRYSEAADLERTLIEFIDEQFDKRGWTPGYRAELAREALKKAEKKEAA